MAVFAIADLHLAFAVPNKSMDVFGKEWERHYDKIADYWNEVVSPDDIVLIPGDISWAMRLEDAVTDLQWIDKLPGKKVIIRGNHDYWWDTVKKVREVLPPSIRAIGNDALVIDDIAFSGARLWDTEEFHFQDEIDFRPNTLAKKEKNTGNDEKIFLREVGRLKMSLEAMPKEAKTKIVLTHYPPIGPEMKDSVVSKLIEGFGVAHCVFGHLHSLKPALNLFGEKNGVHYHLVSCDYLGFKPRRIL